MDISDIAKKNFKRYGSIAAISIFSIGIYYGADYSLTFYELLKKDDVDKAKSIITNYDSHPFFKPLNYAEYRAAKDFMKE